MMVIELKHIAMLQIEKFLPYLALPDLHSSDSCSDTSPRESVQRSFAYEESSTRPQNYTEITKSLRNVKQPTSSQQQKLMKHEKFYVFCKALRENYRCDLIVLVRPFLNAFIFLMLVV